MEEIVLSPNDEVVMKLLHYFITEQNYSPIILKGAQNEIWLENLSGDYKIVRLVSNYIHNNEQLDMDIFRTQQIVKRIQKKTLSLSMSTLNIFVNLGENVGIDEFDIYNMDFIKIKEVDDLKEYDFVIEEFPTITNKTTFKESGVELFMKITGEIGKKNDEDAKIAEETFTKKDPIITKILLAINALIFVASFFINPDFIASIGANIGVAVLKGEVFRLITSAFIHFDILHFAFNMYALYIIGAQIENFYGKRKMLAIYFGSAIIGSMLSVTLNNHVISIGASGAIFGLLGALVYFGYHYRVYLDTVIKSQILPLIFINLIIGAILSGIDNAAHVGGLIGGILVSMMVGVKYKSTKADIINGIIMTLIFVAFLSYMMFFR